MKSMKICLALLFLVVSFVFAQDGFKLSEITSNIGKGAFTSGFDITLKFKGQGDLLGITGNHQRGYAIYLWDLPFSLNAGVSGGFFKNMPWTGPYILISPTNFLSFFHWSGWRAGEPENPGTEVNTFFISNGLFLKLGRLQVNYVLMDFLGEKTSIPGILYTMPINKDFKGFIGIDYKVSEEESLFHIGLSYFPD